MALLFLEFSGVDMRHIPRCYDSIISMDGKKDTKISRHDGMKAYLNTFMSKLRYQNMQNHNGLSDNELLLFRSFSEYSDDELHGCIQDIKRNLENTFDNADDNDYEDYEYCDCNYIHPSKKNAKLMKDIEMFQTNLRIIKRIFKIRKTYAYIIRRFLNTCAKRWRAAKKAKDIRFAYEDTRGCRERKWAKMVLSYFLHFWICKRNIAFNIHSGRLQFMKNAILRPQYLTFLCDEDYVSARKHFENSQNNKEGKNYCICDGEKTKDGSIILTTV